MTLHMTESPCHGCAKGMLMYATFDFVLIFCDLLLGCWRKPQDERWPIWLRILVCKERLSYQKISCIFDAVRCLNPENMAVCVLATIARPRLLFAQALALGKGGRSIILLRWAIRLARWYLPILPLERWVVRAGKQFRSINFSRPDFF